mmetsp:Transcript_4098/g.4573  ORF Transcript_4098/g.4573 Transcript_4098/m.4573 type:complete len:202 (-) Transcript_4098:826-1431(-)
MIQINVLISRDFCIGVITSISVAIRCVSRKSISCPSPCRDHTTAILAHRLIATLPSMRFPKSSDANSFSKAATMGTGSIVSLLEVDENEPAAVSVELLVVEDNVVVFTAVFLFFELYLVPPRVRLARLVDVGLFVSASFPSSSSSALVGFVASNKTLTQSISELTEDSRRPSIWTQSSSNIVAVHEPTVSCISALTVSLFS